MLLLGYISLLLMGMSLGLLGAGGSILTLPILVYFFKMPVNLATTYSLAIVGTTACIASINYRKTIVINKALIFLVPSMIGIICARSIILPTLPLSFKVITLEEVLLLLLILLMFTSSYLMIKNVKFAVPTFFLHHKTLMQINIVCISVLFGIIMGILGSGGGFLIIPILTLLINFTMQEAISTSLFIITLNSFAGFIADSHRFEQQDWFNIINYTIIPVVGMFISMRLNKYITPLELKTSFGWFIFIVALGIGIATFYK